MNDRNIHHVTKALLIEILINSRKGCSTVSIIARYDLDTQMLKTGNPFLGKGYYKIGDTVIMVQFDYAKSMHNRSDGDQEAANNGKSPYTPVFRDDGTKTPLVTLKSDNSKFYLAGEFVSSDSHVFDKNGAEINKETFRAFWKDTDMRNNVKTTKLINWKVVSLNNILRIRVDGDEYHLIHGEVTLHSAPVQHAIA